MSHSCESCGADEHALYPVHRKYVTPGSWETEASERTLTDVEHWCYACCTHYPHVPAEG